MHSNFSEAPEKEEAVRQPSSTMSDGVDLGHAAQGLSSSIGLAAGLGGYANMRRRRTQTVYDVPVAPSR